jgi:hypothetical protein
MRIFEIDTWTWLDELGERGGRPVTLATVPADEWDALRPYRFDAVWLMGVWRRSAVGRAMAQADPDVRAGCARVYPGFRPERDVEGSPYCVAEYAVDPALGGRAGLAAARRALSARGLQLVLDFVPNHTAPDHAWIVDHPEYYVRGTEADLAAVPRAFFRTGRGDVLACGAPSRNPASVWRDVAQLDAFDPGLRGAAIATLRDIADQCDGVRCDMAMLLRSETFLGTWGAAAGPRPATEYWREVIGEVRRTHPGLRWIAEAYGGTEGALQEDGFDLCYDKGVYDALVAGDAAGLRTDLQRPGGFQQRLLHFVANHDEKPAGEVFAPPERLWAAAVVTATLPGSSLWHAPQLEGWWGRAPVQLGRSVSARSFYRRLLAATDRPALREGAWALCPVANAPSMLAWCWARGGDRVLVVVNLSGDTGAWGHVALPWPDLDGRQWKLRDLLGGAEYGPRDGRDMIEGRLYVEPRSWGAELFEIVPG